MTCPSASAAAGATSGEPWSSAATSGSRVNQPGTMCEASVEGSASVTGAEGS
ncbi:hypothetical protein [Streptomyces sp. NPDC127100]|uniref:hypothetical protein n=1 Tax=Streptomyces sp. NPDC127100 TaxID=3347138 RepID=UPI00366731A2